MRLKEYCEHCGKPLRLVASHKLTDGVTLHEFKCGHFDFEVRLTISFNIQDLTSVDGTKNAYEYQREGIEFVASTGNAIITDQMGLGKTVQAIKWSVLDTKQKCTLILVRSATSWQWLNEIKTWGLSAKTGVFVVQGTNGWIPPGFRFYVMSMDTFSRLVTVETTLSTAETYYNTWDKSKNTKVTINELLDSLPIDSVIVDECHSFKNQSSKRSQALVAYCQTKNIEKKLFLSGTPIKNRADEYFVPLNLCRPDLFPSIARFRRDWLVQDYKGKWSKINPYRMEEFQSMLSEFVIRREVNDVMKDLPSFRRIFTEMTIEDETLKAQYNKELARMQGVIDGKSNFSYWDVRENLMTLRRITGLAKVSFVVQYVDLFLDSTEQEKIAIGIHHKGVRDLLYNGLMDRGIKTLKLSGEDSAENKERIKKEFSKPDNRVLIISELAGGVGMDGLQIANNVLVIERQWSSADEEQFEARFWRNGQTRPVLAEYLHARGTIEEYFSALVEEKRGIFKDVVQWSGLDLSSNTEALRDVVEKAIHNKL
jgi:SWI/SNF-related matrix-associated actin-dependent regulator 1 of chromatin subfamily A